MIKPGVTAILVACGILVLYRFVDINLFRIDVTKKTSNLLQSRFKNDLPHENGLILFNTGTLGIDEIQKQLDTLLSFYPANLGVNLCYLSEAERRKIQQKRGLVICECGSGAIARSSVMVNEDNSVTRFAANSSMLFEIKLSRGWLDLVERKNEVERINFRGRHSYLEMELKNADGFDPEFIQGKTVLVGYLGDQISEDIVDFKQTHITPLNPEHGQQYISPDMYELEISANIISMIWEKEFINEIPGVIRILTILAFSICTAASCSLIRTRWIVLNVLLSLVAFIFFVILGGLLIVVAFEFGYFLELDELPLILIVTTISASLPTFRAVKAH